ncbi:4Fe-4S cluster-binding domain-containing protein [Erysipelotrichaceae bacterium OttesenSCG-928-M19]|nr:4Fe-4S cluster-binding domain-containing protein [Erysipelotrichaceae bacterium OttesenSCG-928-M19]
MIINLAGIIDDSIVDGPGLRIVIFFQGCQHDCYNCHNKDTHSMEDNKLMSVAEIVSYVKANPLINKVTISGGEPFLQYDGLLELCQALQDYKLWLYTGYTIAELKALNYDAVFQYLEALVDGKFIEAQKTLDLPYIGSKNQTIHYFK